MTLQEHIDEIRNDLRNEAFINEASVSQGIVLRLLHALGWPWYNTRVVFPEYSVERGSVDFALCHPPSKPLVIIEVKQVGKIKDAEQQLFKYAFHTGVPIAVLTDGREWHFFYPTGQESEQEDYRERRVCQLDLIKTDSRESAECLHRYLNYNLIRNRKATQAIALDELPTIPDYFEAIVKEYGFNSVQKARPQRIVAKDPEAYDIFTLALNPEDDSWDLILNYPKDEVEFEGSVPHKLIKNPVFPANHEKVAEYIRKHLTSWEYKPASE